MTSLFRWRDLGPSLLILALSVVFLWQAKTYQPPESTVPVLVGWLALALALLDVAAQLNTGFGRDIRRLVGASADIAAAADKGDRNTDLWRNAVSIVWPLLYLGGLLVVGTLIATPVYIFLYMTVYGRKRTLTSIVAAAVTTAALWFAFQVLFQYPLYPGLLLAD
jgi:hypothetical protein